MEINVAVDFPLQYLRQYVAVGKIRRPGLPGSMAICISPEFRKYSLH
jgi:hypothetical protein